MGTGVKSHRESARRWKEAHPGYKSPTWDKEKQKARREKIAEAINPCYLKEARAILAGKDVRGKNRCAHLEGD